MKRTEKFTGKKLSELTKKQLAFKLKYGSIIKCLKTHSYCFDSGLSVRNFSYKKGDTDRYGYFIINDLSNWKVLKEKNI